MLTHGFDGIDMIGNTQVVVGCPTWHVLKTPKLHMLLSIRAALDAKALFVNNCGTCISTTIANMELPAIWSIWIGSL